MFVSLPQAWRDWLRSRPVDHCKTTVIDGIRYCLTHEREANDTCHWLP